MNQDFTVQKKEYLSEKKKNSCRGVHLKNKFLHKQWATKKKLVQAENCWFTLCSQQETMFCDT